MRSVRFNDISINNSNLAPSQLEILSIPNENTQFVRDFLVRSLQKKDNGIEVGSANYIADSYKFFVKAKALQSHSFIPIINEETVSPIRPQVFCKCDLKESDIIISKDSNIGEVVMLDRDMPNHMLSGALYKLPVKDKKYYLFAFLKHSYFLKQLDVMTPKGATIRHAGKRFLNCKIPLPAQSNKNEIVEYVETLVKSIIAKEREIKDKYLKILHEIGVEIKNNQNAAKFTSVVPKYLDVLSSGRLDASVYSEELKKIEFSVENYINGYETLKDMGYHAVRGPNLAVSIIGETIYTNAPSPNFYKLIQPTDISVYGTIYKERYLGNRSKLPTLKEGDIIFGAEGNIGKCLVLCEEMNNAVTNYHGMSITIEEDRPLREKIFISLFILYLREKNYFEYYSVGGQGGSFGKEKVENIIIPCFPPQVVKDLVRLYYSNEKFPFCNSLCDFRKSDAEWTREAGLFELSKMSSRLKTKLNLALDCIVNNKDVLINYNFDDI